ncbi:MAG: hypothetical protein JNM94_02495 [Phycisphaerae bacterium]|nr:hypothetical protein [Phycisphaerae bacterium]
MATLGRSDLRAGIATLVTLVVLSVGIMIAPHQLGERRVRYELSVAPTVDLTGLAVGAPVLVGGLDRGRVVAMIGDTTVTGQPGATISIEIRRNPPIYPQAKPVLRMNPISQKALIDFQNVGNPGVTRNPLDEGSKLELVQATEVDSIFTGEMGTRLRAIAERAAGVPEEWGTLRDDAPKRFAAVRDEFEAVRDEMSASWSKTADRARELIERYRKLGDGFNALAEEAKALRGEFAQYQEMNEEGALFPRTKASFQRLTEAWNLMRADADSLGPTLDRARSEWTRATGAFGRIRSRIDEIVGLFDLGPILADVTIAGNLFSKTYSEAMAAPWRVIFPNESAAEAKRDRLDDLTRELLRNAETAKRARESIEEILRVGETTGSQTAEMLERMRKQFESISSLEDAIWKARFRLDTSP